MDMIGVCKIVGKVVHGKGLGRTVGMPTANIEPTKACTLPKEGVYATTIYVGGKSYASLTNIGQRPSVDDEAHVTVEVYILDFNEDIYGETVVLEVKKFIRPIQKFDSLEAVQQQVRKDLDSVFEYTVDDKKVDDKN